jgi:NAD-dependent dihydropyrimidine dehydrogenase PreA subunit/bacterioferritin-associated ferredoxin
LETIELGIEVVDENCTGCYRCERVCPTEAIVMVGPKTEALAVVDNDKCIGCLRCIDSCDDDALLTFKREEPVDVTVDTTDIDEDAIKNLCQAAGTSPTHLVCPCSNRTAQDIAATILQGAHTYEELSLRIGVQSGCLLYCSTPLRRLLLAGTGDARTTSKLRRYDSDQSLMNIAPELEDKYPLFGIRTEQEWRQKEMAEVEVDL